MRVTPVECNSPILTQTVRNTDGRRKEQLTNAVAASWYGLIYTVAKNCGRLPCADVREMLDKNGMVRTDAPYELPHDLLWGTDQPRNGCAYIFLRVIDSDDGSLRSLCVYETRDEGIKSQVIAGIELPPLPPVLDYPGVLDSLRTLAETGRASVERCYTLNSNQAELATASLRLEKSIKGVRG